MAQGGHLRTRPGPRTRNRGGMRSGRKKNEAPSPLGVGEAAVVEGVQEGEEEEEEAGGGLEDEREADEGSKQLAEGFFEIEDIRKKRVCKGQLQYLIKWRGWPETANTWEPFENINSCPDVIEAFEERSSSRKRRRKHGAPNTVTKKKRNGIHSAESGDESPAARPTECWENHGHNGADGIAGAEDGMDGGEGEGEGEGELHGDGKGVAKADGCPGAVTDNEKKIASDKGDAALTKQAAEETAVSTGVREDADGSTDGLSKIDATQPLQGSHFTGAKKRKSGSIRRFKQVNPSSGQGDGQTTPAARSVNESCGKHEKSKDEALDSSEVVVGDKNKLNDTANPLSITKILKPVSYFASVCNNVQEVSVKFEALRSDGKEVFVDDKYLKVNDPLLLIGYYEQHLRCSPHL